MIHKFKILIVGAMALAAFGAISASGAQAAKFHCAVKPCTLTLKTDGEKTTAHHVFVVTGKTPKGEEGSVSFTCESLTGNATVEEEAFESVTFKEVAYDNCKVAGETVKVDMNGCDYKFFSNGKVKLECPTSEHVVLTIAGVACVTITPLEAEGIKYHDVGTEHKEMTAEVSNIVLPNPATNVELLNKENAICKAAVNLASVTGAKYTTGHTIVTGETDVTKEPVMVNTWFE